MVHAYSLIHDDLPCMDNDDMRRESPPAMWPFPRIRPFLRATHCRPMLFETALSADPEKILEKNIIKAARQLAVGAGCNGMCAGQVLDLMSETHKASHEELVEIKSTKRERLS